MGALPLSPSSSPPPWDSLGMMLSMSDRRRLLIGVRLYSAQLMERIPSINNEERRAKGNPGASKSSLQVGSTRHETCLTVS